MLPELTAPPPPDRAAPRRPIVRELPADLDTPTTAYLKLRGQGASFLLESVEGGERVARYSFIGVAPRARYLLRGHAVTRTDGRGQTTIPLAAGRDPLHILQSELAQYPPIERDGLPRFLGGLVGYLGYETVRHFEPGLAPQLPQSDLPDALFLLVDTIVAFDHARSSLLLITHAFDDEAAAAEQRLDALAARLAGEVRPARPGPSAPAADAAFTSNLSQPDFESMVLAAKEHIAAGDIFQIVLSQRFTRRTGAPPFGIYRALRRLNPSPYMFFFEFGDVDGEPLSLIGASPEMMVRFEAHTGRASLRPIAGTRPRGRTPAEDAGLEQALLADAKERAEHVMLVDLGRNDLGRVCAYGSIAVPEFCAVEHYSHVMHLVSHVTGQLRPELTAFDLARAAFPAGTLSGAPKVRAMEIIAGLEAQPRGPYGGAVGYFSFDGAMDMCIAIRTLVARGQSVSVQAGAGIVADSEPAAEFQETINKAQAATRAVELAERGG